MSIRLGKLIGCSPQHLIVQSSRDFKLSLKQMPKLGSTVKMVQREGSSNKGAQKIARVGRLSDVFGPVSRPYFSIKPFAHLPLDEFEAEIGSKFYCEKQSQKYRGRQQKSQKRSRPHQRRHSKRKDRSNKRGKIAPRPRRNS